MKQTVTAVILFCVSILACFVYAGEEEEQQKFDNLDEVSSAFAGAGHVMIELGYRYRALYFAAQQKKWEFAEYQVEEMEELMERFEVISKKRKVAIQSFSKAVFEDLEKSLASKKWETFYASYDAMRKQCMACHVQNEVEFIRLPIPKHHESPILE